MPATQAHWPLPHPQHSHQDPRSWHSLAHFAPGELVGGGGGRLDMAPKGGAAAPVPPGPSTLGPQVVEPREGRSPL